MHDVVNDPATQRFAARRAIGWRQQDRAVIVDIEGVREPDVTGISAILAGARLNDAVERAELSIEVLESGAVRLRLRSPGAGAEPGPDLPAAPFLDEDELEPAPVGVTSGEDTLRIASERHGGYGPDPEDITIEVGLDPFRLTVSDAGGRALVRLASELPTQSDRAGVAPVAWARRTGDDGRITHWTSLSLVLEPDERLFGLGTGSGPLNLVGSTHQIPPPRSDVADVAASAMRSPLLLSSRGPGVLVHTATVVSADLGKGSPSACTLAVAAPSFDMVIFPSTWPRTALSGYARLTGREDAPEPGAFMAHAAELQPPANTASMRAALRAALGYGLSTPGFWAARVERAAATDHANSSLLARWAQLALLSPLLAPAYASSPTPDAQDASVEPIVQAYRHLRRRLLPYLLHCARESAQNGLPMLRPMLLEFSWDADAAELDDQFLLGRDLLVAPIFSDSAEPVTRRVYLPAFANWYDWWTGTLYEGKQWVEVEAPLDRVPIFARAGTVIPLTDPAAYLSEDPGADASVDPPSVTRLLLFAPRDGAIGASVEYGDDDLLGVEQERGERKARIYVEGIPRTLNDLEIIGLPASAHLVDASVPAILLVPSDTILPGFGGAWNSLRVALPTGEFTAGLELGW